MPARAGSDDVDGCAAAANDDVAAVHGDDGVHWSRLMMQRRPRRTPRSTSRQRMPRILTKQLTMSDASDDGGGVAILMIMMIAVMGLMMVVMMADDDGGQDDKDEDGDKNPEPRDCDAD